MSIEKLKELHDQINIADDLSDSVLMDIGHRSCEEFDIDESSRKEWLDSLEGAIKIAKQVMEAKTTPWNGAANVKFPLITSAVISFAARTYPEIIRGDKVVLAGLIGDDDKAIKEQIAKRISNHMSYQLLVESPNWEDDTDKLLHLLPLMGMVYRKSYWDELAKLPGTELCLPEKITVNHKAKTIESARRITHQLQMYDNDLIERMRAGLYRDIDLEKLGTFEGKEGQHDKLHDILEMHRFWDLDGDGYREPYIVTIHQQSQQVLRIKARWDMEDIEVNEKNKVVRIAPTCYFTDYHFLRNPDGGFHSIGYGSLLYPINETINTTLNQLLDAGTLANRQNGFIGKGLRIKKGTLSLSPGEWVQVEASNGTDISRNVVPLPVKEPSPVLLQLLSMMIASGKELASVTDIMQGQQNTQNSPATTVLTLLQQALKTHTAIVKRLYRSLAKEFEKLVRINRLYLEDAAYYETFDGNSFISSQDYANEKIRVFPVADPNMSSEAQRLARAQAVYNIRNEPGIDRHEAMLRFLEAMGVPEIEKLMPPVDPNAPPSPETQKVEKEIQLMSAKIADIWARLELDGLRLEVSDKDRQGRASEAGARVAKMQDDAIVNFAKIEQEGSHFAIEKGLKDLEQTQEIEMNPVDASPVELDPMLMQLIQQAQQNLQPPAPPQQQPMPPEMQPGMEMPPEQLPEGMPQ